MIATLPPFDHKPPVVRSCIAKVRETEWIRVGHNKWVRIVVVKDERGTWHNGRCVPKLTRTHI